MYYSLTSGHRKSLAVVADQGRIIGLAKGDSLNMHTQSESQVEALLRKVVSDLGKTSGTSGQPDLSGPNSNLVFSLPGVSTPHDLQSAARCLARCVIGTLDRCFIADDTWTGLVSGLQSAIGICAFAGTGASV